MPENRFRTEISFREAEIETLLAKLPAGSAIHEKIKEAHLRALETYLLRRQHQAEQERWEAKHGAFPNAS